MNADLAVGMGDGKFKRVAPNRGGVVEDTTAQDRLQMSDQWYGIHEAAIQHLPDGTTHHAGPGGYIATPPFRLA